jgi:hypothetical protein
MQTNIFLDFDSLLGEVILLIVTVIASEVELPSLKSFMTVF